MCPTQPSQWLSSRRLGSGGNSSSLEIDYHMALLSAVGIGLVVCGIICIVGGRIW